MQTISVHVRSMKGKTYILDVSGTMLVSEFKEAYAKKSGNPANTQVLIYYNKFMEDNQTLEYYGVSNNSIIHETAKLRGGGLPYDGDTEFFLIVERILQLSTFH